MRAYCNVNVSPFCPQGPILPHSPLKGEGGGALKILSVLNDFWGEMRTQNLRAPPPINKWNF